ncbi:tyrosine-type recombinase/integrase [Desulfosporosinus sp. HMP52]|uniref:tyrosine-type recombinase/integrase n=1 Tax=Desulfosporosinus sp. HMP52 TaxID=1487923 RepID=UPI0009DD5152|nr:tyrosine-type recombinase/integrase [Desulfosporosinus sp. HMP52]
MIEQRVNSPFQLVGQRSPSMCRDAVATMLERIGKELNIDIDPHKFRHTFCSKLVQKKVPFTTIAN